MNFRRYGAVYGSRLLGIHWVGNDGSANHLDASWNEGMLYHQADWNLYTITWTPNRYDFYINGVRIGGSSSSSGLKPFESNRLRIRGNYSLYDELLIIPYAATEEEIKAWYNSGAPFVDSEEVVSGGKTIINSEGLKAYDSKGNKTVDIGSETGDAFFRGAVIGAVYNE